MTTFEKVREACKAILEQDTVEITPETRLDVECGFDSLRMIRLSYVLENTYGVRFDPRAGSFTSVADIVAYIDAQSGKEACE